MPKSMLLRIAWSSQRRVATMAQLQKWTPDLPPNATLKKSARSKRALRNANNYEEEMQKHADKLKALSAPFLSALIPYDINTNKKLMGNASKIYAYGVQPGDLKALALPEHKNPTPMEARCAEGFHKLLTLQYSSRTEILDYNIQLAIKHFARARNDTGSPEVQAAIWTVRIQMLQDHVARYRHDYPAERKIVEYQDQRRKILRYLKRVSLERYFACVDRLGLPHDLVDSARQMFPALKATHIARLKQAEDEKLLKEKKEKAAARKRMAKALSAKKTKI